MKGTAFSICICVLGVALQACVANEPRAVEHDEAEGALVVDWTLDGVDDPAACRQSSAGSFDLSVYTPGGRLVGEFGADCEAFDTSVPLPAGDYTADAVLLDPDGGDRTTTLSLAPFTILPDADLHIPVDFPSDAFL